jgi:hypothetical protein
LGHHHFLSDKDFACLDCGKTLEQLKEEGVPADAVSMAVFDQELLGIWEKAVG